MIDWGKAQLVGALENTAIKIEWTSAKIVPLPFYVYLPSSGKSPIKNYLRLNSLGEEDD